MSFEIIYSRTNEPFKRGDVFKIISQKSEFRCLADDTYTSALISAILGADHINNDELVLYRQWAFIFESACKHVLKMDSFATGSRIDCSSSFESDEDQMIQMKDTEIISIFDDSNVAGNQFTMDNSSSMPGYTFLHPYTISVDTDRHETKGFLQSLIEKDNVSFLSSEKYLKYNNDLILGMDKYSPLSFQAGEGLRHGPCVMLNYEKQGKDSDMAIGLKCSKWPTASLEWVTRKRKSNWPNPSLVDKIKQMPCHVLPVGHPDSEKCDLEWRFAFVLQERERELIWNFKDIQIQCYVIFKTLKRDFLDPIAPEEINSFHLKTILFWMSEDIVDWNAENLADCVKRCLNLLNKSIAERQLSHYFFRSRNLFFGKLQNETRRSNLKTEIMRIKNNVLSHFLQSKWHYRRDDDFLSSVRLAPVDFSEKEFLKFCREILHQGKNDKRKRKTHSHARRLSMEVTLSVMYLPATYESLIKVSEEIEQELKETLMGIYALKFLSIRFGMLYLEEAKITANREIRLQHGASAKWCSETGLAHDTLAACMYSMTYHYQTGNYKIIGKFLDQLFSRHIGIPYKGTPGLMACGHRNIVSPDMFESVSEDDIENDNDIAFDVIFSCSDIRCVPPAVQFELALLDGNSNWCFCSVHPLVYASYMRFQVATNHQNIQEMSLSVNHFRKMVNYTEGREGKDLVDVHRHYNILGYCFYIINEVEEAIKWFIKSLEMCPSSGNAALYHLCIILSNS